MSYRRAWSLMRAMNGDFRSPLVDLVAGGRGGGGRGGGGRGGGGRGGGAALTELGREALRLYRPD